MLAPNCERKFKIILFYEYKKNAGEPLETQRVKNLLGYRDNYLEKYIHLRTAYNT